ncbi:MAG TPA: MaoC family dehydratase [Ktedonobacterales bacterium]|nr:MaoC family dehydratase [Ktedonobacterales bacterium]
MIDPVEGMAAQLPTVGMAATRSRTITEADIVLYAGLTGDQNPIHLDADFAARSPFGGRIAHGMLTAGLISAVLGNDLPGPGAIYLAQSLRFLAPVRIGDTITARVEVTAVRADRHIVTLRTECANQDNLVVLSGEAVVKC